MRRNRKQNLFRIIGGQWRSRRLTFPDNETIRPSPDRVRETLFNWLRSSTEGARCLDLFAGSGALGFEVLSRGAGRVVFVDHNPAVVRTIRDHLSLLSVEGSEVIRSDALKYLGASSERFDIVFLDPPFGDGNFTELFAALVPDRLKPGARVYIEHAAGARPEPPKGWDLLRSARAGKVEFHLLAGETE